MLDETRSDKSPDADALNAEALEAEKIEAFRAVMIEFAQILTTVTSEEIGDGQRAKDVVNDLLAPLYNDAFPDARFPLRNYLSRTLYAEK